MAGAGWRFEAASGGVPDYVPLEGGYAVPRRIVSTGSKGDLRVTVESEVIDGSAVVGKVTVETDAEGGVTQAMLREVPIRDVVANGAKAHLARVEIAGKGARIAPVKTYGEDEAAAISRLVGYLRREVGQASETSRAGKVTPVKTKSRKRVNR